MVSKKISFGVGIPTGTEGLMYPVPFASAKDNVNMALKAESLGYDSVWGNDHVSTQKYVAKEFSQPPNYYNPPLVLAAIAQATTKIKLGTALLVLPFRHPVMAAKEIATLDHLSAGRLLLGIGIGAYREEFAAMWGDQAAKMNRGRMLDESITALKLLFTENNASLEGEYFRFKDVQTFPKPVQNPFPFYIGGNSPEGRRRVAEHGLGWLPAVLSPEEISAGIQDIEVQCAIQGRSIEEIDIAPQFSVAIGRTHEEAIGAFQRSQVYKHMISLKSSTLKDQQNGSIEDRNLIGTPDEIGEKITRYVQAGVTTFSALLFCANSLQEFYESMEWFSREVMARF